MDVRPFGIWLKKSGLRVGANVLNMEYFHVFLPEIVQKELGMFGCPLRHKQFVFSTRKIILLDID